MKKVAIVKIYRENTSNDDYDNYRKIIDSITEWTNVSDEEYKALQWWIKNQKYGNSDKYEILEFIELNGVFIMKTTADYIKMAKQQEQEAEIRQKAKEEKEAKIKATREKNRKAKVLKEAKELGLV